MGSYLSDEQIVKLLDQINPKRVSQRDGLSYVEAYEIRAHLTRIFGFAGWSADTQRMELLFEDEKMDERKKRPGWHVGYRAQVRLAVFAPRGGQCLATYTEWATGKASNQPDRGDAHDLALKSAESQALKRCAVNLGDSYGLSLYSGGKVSRIVGRTLVGVEGSVEATEAVDSHITTPIPPEVDSEWVPPEPEADLRIVSTPPVREVEVPKKVSKEELQARIAAIQSGRKP